MTSNPDEVRITSASILHVTRLGKYRQMIKQFLEVFRCGSSKTVVGLVFIYLLFCMYKAALWRRRSHRHIIIMCSRIVVFCETSWTFSSSSTPYVRRHRRPCLYVKPAQWSAVTWVFSARSPQGRGGFHASWQRQIHIIITCTRTQRRDIVFMRNTRVLHISRSTRCTCRVRSIIL